MLARCWSVRVLLYSVRTLMCAITLFLCSCRTVFGSNLQHYNDVIMGAITSQIISLMIVYSIVYSDADQRKHQSSASLAFVRGIHRGPVKSPHKWPVTRKMFPFDDVIMRHVIKMLVCSRHAVFTLVSVMTIFICSRFTLLGICHILL